MPGLICTRVKVCDVCASSANGKFIASCCECMKISRHLYCMKELMLSFPKYWVCETCEACLMEMAVSTDTSSKPRERGNLSHRGNRIFPWGRFSICFTKCLAYFKFFQSIVAIGRPGRS